MKNNHDMFASRGDRWDTADRDDGKGLPDLDRYLEATKNPKADERRKAVGLMPSAKKVLEANVATIAGRKPLNTIEKMRQRMLNAKYKAR